MATVVNATNESVNQTVNQGLEKASSSGLQQMLQDPAVIMALGLATIIGLSFLIAKFIAKKSNKDSFQGKTLQERLKEKQVDPAMEFGRKTKKKIDYGMTELGVLEKYYNTTETLEEDITSDAIIESIQKENAEKAEELEKDVKNEDNSFKNVTMIVGPTGFFSRLKMNIKTSDPLENPHVSVYSVPVESVTVSDRVSINDEKVDWNHSGGIYYSNDVKGMNTMLNYSALSLVEDVAETFADKGELLQALNEKHAEWKSRNKAENEAFINYMKEKEGIDADSATD